MRRAACSLLPFVLVTALLAACGGGSDPVIADAPDGDDAPAIDAADVTTITALDGEHIYFGDPNRRTVDVPVTFPAAGGHYTRVTLHLGLRCPTGGCDWWDRLGRLSLVLPDDAGEVELARFITPYRVGAQLELDVTELQRLLEGGQTLRVFIDTWVGPGHPNGAGWLVDASFDFEAGTPAAGADPFAVIPLFAPGRVVYGDPARPIDVATSVDIPADATSLAVRALITGHGQGNANNCAEFCSREHGYAVGAEEMSIELWRDDCATTAAPGQQGTWMYPRAGWCPGAIVHPWRAEFAAVPGALPIRYDVEPYENTCRPDAPTCAGCTLGTGCAYDDGAHTEPGWEQSALLVLYR